MRGYESEEGYIQRELLKTLSEGDLVRIGYYAPKYRNRIIRLFEVKDVHGDMYMFELKSWGMVFVICDFRFHEEDIEEYNPIIKSIIYKKDLDKIEHNVIDFQIQENEIGKPKRIPTIKEILEDWDNPEFKEKRLKAAKETIDKLNKQVELRDEMMSDPNYIEWLCNFTKKTGGSFYDDEWDYKPEEITDYDRKNVDNLNIFFEGIDLYAKKNDIPCNQIAFGATYFVRYNDVDLEIGFMVGQGSLAFSRMIIAEENFINNCIDFNDVLKKNKGKSRTKKI